MNKYKDLPAGIGPEGSPLFDFPKNPYQMFKHVIRYYYVADNLLERLFKEYSGDRANLAQLNILDVGCGNAEMYPFISSYVRPAGYSLRYHGIDGDPNRIERARDRFRSTFIQQGFLPQGLEKLSGNVFQGIICSEVYEHLTPEEGRQLLTALLSLTESRTVATFTIPTPLYSRYRSNPLHQNEIWPKDFIYTAGECGWMVTDWFWLRSEGKRIHPNVPVTLSGPILAPSKELTEKGGHIALYNLRRNDYGK